MTSQVVTANRLGDGIVVYLAEGGAWIEDIGASRIARGEDEGKTVLGIGEQAARDSKVVAPYLIEVKDEAGRIVPTRYREWLRAFGPSSHPEFGRPQTAVAGG